MLREGLTRALNPWIALGILHRAPTTTVATRGSLSHHGPARAAAGSRSIRTNSRPERATRSEATEKGSEPRHRQVRNRGVPLTAGSGGTEALLSALTASGRTTGTADPAGRLDKTGVLSHD
jgi:hypothetical protein